MRIWMVGLLALSSLALAGGGQRTATTLQFAGSGCRPALRQVVVGVRPDAAASRRMAQIFAADQAARQVDISRIDWSTVTRQDEARRVETLKLLQTGRLSTPTDLVGAAFLFQHGDCPESYQLANALAAQAIARGEAPDSTPHPVARWIYAATYDRWLTSRGLPQKYGTQYRGTQVCQFTLEPYDPATTDLERARYDVPPLAQALAQADEFSAECLKNQAP